MVMECRDDRLSVEWRGVSHGTFPVVGGSTRCACTLNTFDTMDYGYLNAIRPRAFIRAETIRCFVIKQTLRCSQVATSSVATLADSGICPRDRHRGSGIEDRATGDLSTAMYGYRSGKCQR